jgi:hypothetical protein
MDTQNSDVVTEATYELSTTPEQAWRALEEVSILHRQPDGPDDWWLPGFESVATEIGRDVGRQLTVRKAAPPCEGTVIEMTFEHTASGSRVRVTQCGFDQAFIDVAGDSFFTHAANIYLDLHAFFETGVVAERAWRWPTPLGLTTSSRPHGPVVTAIEDGTWAQRAGLAPGDTIFSLHGVPTFTSHDVAVVRHVVRSGDEVTVTWARDAKRHTTSAVL